MLMTKHDRLDAAIHGQETDRPLAALWRHFPTDDLQPEQLALSTAAFQTQYDWDFVKLTPSSSYGTEDWGDRVVYRGSPEGTSEHLVRPLEGPQDWARLEVLNPRIGALGQQLTTIERLRALIGPDIPMIETVFSPLYYAKNLIGNGLEVVHLRRHRIELQHALDVIAETTVRFVRAALAAGADGIFYAIQHASARLLSEAEYREVCRPLDLRILEATQDRRDIQVNAPAETAANARRDTFNILHLHGLNTYFDLVADYPVQALNWHDRDTGPSLAEGARRFPGLVVGGLSQHDIVEGTPQSVRALAQEAIAQMGRRRVCLSTGCVMPTVTPWGNIRALRESVDG